MTCGICHPEAFGPNQSSRAFGYAVAKDQQEAVDLSRGLYFMGCSYVFCDVPVGRIGNRAAWKRLCSLVQRGDRVVLPSFKTLGDRPSRQGPNLDRLEALGVEVFALTPDNHSIC